MNSNFTELSVYKFYVIHTRHFLASIILNPMYALRVIPFMTYILPPIVSARAGLLISVIMISEEGSSVSKHVGVTIFHKWYNMECISWMKY